MWGGRNLGGPHSQGRPGNGAEGPAEEEGACLEGGKAQDPETCGVPEQRSGQARDLQDGQGQPVLEEGRDLGEEAQARELQPGDRDRDEE
jgi:hypothetical protein